MLAVNNANFTGRLTKDPQTKHFDNGNVVTKFSIAVPRGVKKGNEWVEETVFLTCECWGKQAEKVGEWLKGQPVYIQGSFKLERWEQNGEKRQQLVLIGTQVTKFDVPSKKQADDAEPAPAEDNIPW